MERTAWLQQMRQKAETIYDHFSPRRKSSQFLNVRTRCRLAVKQRLARNYRRYSAST